MIIPMEQKPIRWLIAVNMTDAPGFHIEEDDAGYIVAICCRSFDEIDSYRKEAEAQITRRKGGAK